MSFDIWNYVITKYKIPKIIQDYVIKQNFVSRNVSRKRYSWYTTPTQILNWFYICMLIWTAILCTQA